MWPMLPPGRRKLEREFINISETERRRLAREIHDGLGQSLTTIGLFCKALDTTNRQTKDGKKLFKEMSEIVQQAIRQVRGISRLFFPASLRSGQLGEALRLLSLDVSQSPDIRCVLAEGESVRLADHS